MTAWPMVALGEVAELQAGFGFPLDLQGRRSGDYPFAKVGDISRHGRAGSRFISESDHFVDKVDLQKLRAKPVRPGSTLFAKIGEAIRQNHRVMAAGPMLIDNNAMAAMPRDSIDSVFLFRFLQTVDLYQHTASTTVPALRKSDLERLAIPLPPLIEQRRIAAILDHADALRAKRREALARLDELTQSIFIAMFGVDDGSIRTVALSDVADISSGITKGRKLNGASVRPIPYLAVANVQDKALELSTVKLIDATEAEIDRLRLRGGDLLLTEGGDPDKLGRGSLWREELPEAIHQNHIFRVRANTEAVNPTYLNWAVGSRAGKSYFLRSAKQTTGIASINMSQLKSFPLVLPPLQRQDGFALRVGAVEMLSSQHRTALSELDALFASLQSRGFRGGL